MTTRNIEVVDPRANSKLVDSRLVSKKLAIPFALKRSKSTISQIAIGYKTPDVSKHVQFADSRN